MLNRFVLLMLLSNCISHINSLVIHKYEKPIHIYPEEINMSDKEFLDMIMFMNDNNVESNVKNLEGNMEVEQQLQLDGINNVRTRSIRNNHSQKKVLNRNGYTLDFNVDLFISLVSANVVRYLNPLKIIPFSF